MNKKLRKKQLKLKISYFITLFVGVSFAYFMWLTWQRLTNLLGNGWLVWGITGSIVLIAILFGYFSFSRIAKRFTA